MSRPLLLLGLTLLLAGCAADVRLRVARFLFDGVPPAAGEAEAGNAPAAVRLPGSPVAEAPPPPLFTHEPYGRGDCRACHDVRASGGAQAAAVPVSASPPAAMLGKPVPELCFDCHAREKIEEHHSRAGDCASCHNPHQSPNEHLLDAVSGATAQAVPAGGTPPAEEPVDQVTGASADVEAEAPPADAGDPPDQVTGATAP